MPKFYKQNKKRIDPRHFLEETVNRGSQDTQLAPGAVKSDVLLSQTMTDFSKKVGGMGRTFYPSVMYRILRTGNISGEPGNESNGVSAAIDYVMKGVGQELPPGALEGLEKDLKFVKQTIDLESGQDSGPNFQPSRQSPFRDQRVSEGVYDGLTNEEIDILEMMIYEGILDEGFMGDIASKSSTALKTLALTAAIIAPVTMSAGEAAAAPKAKVERMIINGKMTAKQKKRLANHKEFLNMKVDVLNKNSDVRKQLQRSVRSMELRIIGASEKDFPMGQEVSAEELRTFLLTGKAPGKKAAKKSDRSWTDSVSDFASDAVDATRKGLKYLDRDSPIGLNTGLFDKE